MREEWLGAWGEVADYVQASFSGMVRLAPLSQDELRRAIVRPASIEGTVQVSTDIVQQILVDLRKPNAFGMGLEYIEPGLLQLVCQRLWDEAVRRGGSQIDTSLYNELGGADQIARDYVWRELRSAGSRDAYFSELDRVLWVGMTRHLSMAPGVKSIVSASALARRLRTEDLGVAGPAALDYELTPKERKYLDAIPEKRSEPPAALVNWISRVLTLGRASGFLKSQHGSTYQERLYELSHDALSPFLQQFSVEFESWMRTRFQVVLLGLAGVVFLGPLFILSLVLLGLLKTLLFTAIAILTIGLYLVLIYLMSKVFTYMYEVLVFPIVRLLARGDPVKRKMRKRDAK
jgi:hypothetical protein